MANPNPIYVPLPLDKSDLEDYHTFAIPDEELQLQVDAINVIEKRVALSSFDAEYQKKIRNYYRFSATRMYSDYPKVAMRTPDTLDII